MPDLSQSTIPNPQHMVERADFPVPSRGARLNTKRESAGLRLRLLIYGWLQKYPRLHGYAVSLDSFGWRSEFLSRLHVRQLLVDFGTALEKAPSGRLVPNRRTRSRIQDTETFVSSCPKATLFERWVFLQGWNAGERFALCNSDRRETERDIQP